MGASKNLSSSPSSECVTQLLRVQGHSRHHQNMILRMVTVHLIRSWCEFQLLTRRAERRCDGSGPEGSVRDVVLDSCAPVRPLGVVVLDPSPNDVVELITTEVHEEFRHSHFNVVQPSSERPGEGALGARGGLWMHVPREAFQNSFSLSGYFRSRSLRTERGTMPSSYIHIEAFGLCCMAHSPLGESLDGLQKVLDGNSSLE